MYLGQINYSQLSCIPKNYSPKAQKTVTFGTNLVNFDELHLTKHVKERMDQRKISLNELKETIINGRAYKAQGDNAIRVLKNVNLMVVIDQVKKSIISAWRPGNEWHTLKFEKNGDLSETTHCINNDVVTLYHLLPEKTTKKAVTQLQNVKHHPKVKNDSNNFKYNMGILLPDGKNLEFNRIIAYNGHGFKDIKADGTLIKAKYNTSITDEAGNRNKISYSYIPSDGVIICYGKKIFADGQKVFAKETQEFANLKEQYFADCE